MTGSLWLDWALISVSLFNLVLLLWLGLTVLLNVERRTLGAWLLGGGLLLGAAFFTIHTALLRQPLAAAGQSIDLWWQVGWIPAIGAPFVWYGLILWYAGFWSEPGAPLRRRHGVWLFLLGATALILLALMQAAHAPSSLQFIRLDSTAAPAQTLHLLLTLYPAFIVTCILLSIDALRHPVPALRVMGDLARARTRPWLMATAAMLLVVSLLVAWFVLWTLGYGRALPSPRLPQPQLDMDFWHRAFRFDLLIGTLIALTVLLLGQAIVSYELFTGRTLPRRGFFRHWRSAVILATGYAVLVGGSLAASVRPIYSLLLTTVLMVTFYALFSWRSFVERERFMAQLRPFVGSQQLAQRILGQSEDGTARAGAIFHAVCADVLNVDQAHLLPLGTLGPLAGPPLAYPAPGRTIATEQPDMDALAAGSDIVDPLEPARPDGLKWAIPLWAERGLIGVMLLGDKLDGGLFAQEEIESAQASGERIVDMLAGAEIARRLTALQRRRLSETRVLDHRTRRTLHDDVLPDLHTVILHLNSASGRDAGLDAAVATLTNLHHQIADLIRVGPNLYPFTPGENLIQALRHMVDAEFAAEFAEIAWHVTGTSAALERPAFDPLVEEVIFYAVREVVRNAAIHGRGDAPARALHLTVRIRCGDPFSISIQDNGVGLPTTQTPETGATDADGRQGGLALHSTMLAVVGGCLTIASSPNHGTKVCITAPASRPPRPNQ